MLVEFLGALVGVSNHGMIYDHCQSVERHRRELPNQKGNPKEPPPRTPTEPAKGNGVCARARTHIPINLQPNGQPSSAHGLAGFRSAWQEPHKQQRHGTIDAGRWA
ncbi:hypothetical protein ZHAS_00014319 [Anopheles sinensis]|uniref:Uncharacterized protein n=1 Tax=Anopheles sinensis TaxID=74873 RepID=A0A084W7Y3_ANOSI|nr:hypothetical protein ZHAS_00014319 [Anopheles sinensis]